MCVLESSTHIEGRSSTPAALCRRVRHALDPVPLALFVCVCRFFETISEEIDVKTSFESFGAAIVVVVFFSSVKTLRDEVI